MIIAVAIEKGGSAKTTTVVNTAAILGQHGKKVLVVDMDPQANATTSLGLLPEDYFDSSIYHLLKGDIDFKGCVIKTDYLCDLIPSNKALSELVVDVLTDLESYPAPLHLLRNVLDKVKHDYDYILMDTPPEIGFNTITSLIACDKVLIPLQCESHATRGVVNLINAVKKYNEQAEIMGILPTMFNRNTNISTQILQDARQYFNDKVQVYDTTIYRTVKFPEADYYNKPAIAYSDNEHVQNYRQFVKECFGIG
jgi:chromosome partitioning protein